MMDRLTTRGSEERALARIGGNSGLQEVGEYPRHEYAPHIERLAAYEDTGLTPEQCRELAQTVKNYDHYIRRQGNLPDCNTCGAKRECPHAPRLGEYVRVNCPLWREGAGQ